MIKVFDGRTEVDTAHQRSLADGYEHIETNGWNGAYSGDVIRPSALVWTYISCIS